MIEISDYKSHQLITNQCFTSKPRGLQISKHTCNFANEVITNHYYLLISTITISILIYCWLKVIIFMQISSTN